jgi:hypothetical protein
MKPVSETPAGLRSVGGLLIHVLWAAPDDVVTPWHPCEAESHPARSSLGLWSGETLSAAALLAETYCPTAEHYDGLRECLNTQIGTKMLSYECLRVLLPRGSLELTLPDVKRLGKTCSQMWFKRESM